MLGAPEPGMREDGWDLRTHLRGLLWRAPSDSPRGCEASPVATGPAVSVPHAASRRQHPAFSAHDKIRPSPSLAPSLAIPLSGFTAPAALSTSSPFPRVLQRPGVPHVGVRKPLNRGQGVRGGGIP